MLICLLLKMYLIYIYINTSCYKVILLTFLQIIKELKIVLILLCTTLILANKYNILDIDDAWYNVQSIESRAKNVRHLI